MPAWYMRAIQASAEKEEKIRELENGARNKCPLVLIVR
jgi:hypothetical protein